MDPESIANIEIHLKSVNKTLEAVKKELEKTNKNFKRPDDKKLALEIFTNQNSLYSSIKYQLLNIDNKIKELDQKVNSLQEEKDN